jgi:hypothetical protein
MKYYKILVDKKFEDSKLNLSWKILQNYSLNSILGKNTLSMIFDDGKKTRKKEIGENPRELHWINYW